MVPELIQLLHCNLTKIKIKTVYFSNGGSRSLYRVWAPALWLKPRWDPLPLPQVGPPPPPPCIFWIFEPYVFWGWRAREAGTQASLLDLPLFSTR